MKVLRISNGTGAGSISWAAGTVGYQKTEIISDSPETDRNFTEEEKPEETVVLRNTDKRTGRRISRSPQHRRKPAKKKQKFEPLVAAAVIMVIAVCIVVGVFIWLLKEKCRITASEAVSYRDGSECRK